MRMPPLPADSIHARACKLKCEKILTRPRCRNRLSKSAKKNTPYYKHSMAGINMAAMLCLRFFHQ